MPGLLGPQHEALRTTIAEGYSVALATICLLQYVYSLYRMKHARGLTSKFQQQVNNLSLEMLQIDRDRMIHRLENQILRDVLTQTECRKAVAVLLKRFVPNPEDAFAAFVRFEASQDPVIHARGLSQESVDAMSVPDEVREQLRVHGAVIWEAPTRGSCPFIATLHPNDRKKCRFLVAIACQEGDQLLGILLTTALFPLTAPRSEQLELTMRLMQAIAPSFRQSLELEQQTSQLQCTREMLELRAITDNRFDQPIRMIEAFLVRLCDMVGGDAVRLFLITRERGEELRTMFRHGATSHAGILDAWMEHEERLAQSGNAKACLLAYDRPQLRQIGVDSLIGSALTVPIIQNDAVMGVVCVTRRSPDRPNETQRQLVAWSAETLSHTMSRALNLVAIERQARQDGLTELSNRRTFDANLSREFAAARNGKVTELSLLLLDLDRFKSINDQHGHPAGDEVLRTAAKILREVQARTTGTDRSTTARYGGEELAFILPQMGLEQAQAIAEDFRSSLEKQVIRFNNTEIRVTVSIGVATFPAHGHDAQELISAADAALYRAKVGGRNRIECGNPDLALHGAH